MISLCVLNTTSFFFCGRAIWALLSVFEAACLLVFCVIFKTVGLHSTNLGKSSVGKGRPPLNYIGGSRSLCFIFARLLKTTVLNLVSLFITGVPHFPEMPVMFTNPGWGKRVYICSSKDGYYLWQHKRFACLLQIKSCLNPCLIHWRSRLPHKYARCHS